MRYIVRSIPERQDCVDYLQRRIPGLEICQDRKRDAMDTFLRALEMAGNDPAVHLEDDIVLARDFTARVEQEISRLPGDVIQFFSMRAKDLTEGSRWDRNFLMGQCFYLPAGWSLRVREFFGRWWPLNRNENPTGLDLMVGDYLRSVRQSYWIHCPSLVDHRNRKSAINPRRSTKRQSKTFKDPWK